MNKIIKVLGTPSKSDWPEGYKMAQTKSNNKITKITIFQHKQV